MIANQRTTVDSALEEHVVRIRKLEASVGGGGGECGAWVEATLVGAWTNAGSPFDTVGYRLCPDGLEFKGHATGGASGSVAFYLDGAYWPTYDISGATDVISGSGVGAAQIYVSSVDGSVTITNIVVP